MYARFCEIFGQESFRRIILQNLAYVSYYCYEREWPHPIGYIKDHKRQKRWRGWPMFKKESLMYILRQIPYRSKNPTRRDKLLVLFLAFATGCMAIFMFAFLVSGSTLFGWLFNAARAAILLICVIGFMGWMYDIIKQRKPTEWSNDWQSWDRAYIVCGIVLSWLSKITVNRFITIFLCLQVYMYRAYYIAKVY